MIEFGDEEHKLLLEDIPAEKAYAATKGYDSYFEPKVCNSSANLSACGMSIEVPS